MNDVYIINLKDNRAGGINLQKADKFNKCQNACIIAIGWTDKAKRTADPDFERAYNTLLHMKQGDLVWTRNPETKEYYLCTVTDDVDTSKPLKEKSASAFTALDIACCRDVEFKKIGTKNHLPAGITYRNLISRQTARRIKNKDVIRITNTL